MRLLFENEIAFTASIKNEAPYMDEWIRYHHQIGVDKFYIYDNDSDDRELLLKVLEPWIEQNIVELETIHGRARQVIAYNDSLNNHRFDCRYMGFFDIDEFVFVKNGQTFLELVDDVFSMDSNINGLGIIMRIFGSNGRKFYEPEDVIDRFVMRQRDSSTNGISMKTLTNPRFVEMMYSVHYPENYMVKYSADENGSMLKNKLYEGYNSTNKIQLNHYIVKSREEYDQKSDRGPGTGEDFDREEKFHSCDVNEVEDRGLKKLWHEIKHLPVRPNLKTSDDVLKNVATMLENPDLSVEKYLTCLMLSKKLDNISENDRIFMQNLSLDGLLKSIEAGIKLPEAFLLVDFIPDIVTRKNDTTKKILYEVMANIPQMMEFLCDDKVRYFDGCHHLRIKYKMLQSIFNGW